MEVSLKVGATEAKEEEEKKILNIKRSIWHVWKCEESAPVLPHVSCNLSAIAISIVHCVKKEETYILEQMGIWNLSEYTKS